MLRIGLTGGIGSGKTTVSNHFVSLGIPVIDADVIAHRISEPDQPATQQIRNHWGENIIAADGSLDRARMRKQVFSDPQQLTKLESILHPAIKQEIKQQIQQLKAQGTSYCLIVIPLLFEKEFTDLIDKVITIDLPVETQIERVMARDKISRMQVEKILQHQLSRQERIDRSDHVINNTGNQQELVSQIEKLHQQFRQRT